MIYKQKMTPELALSKLAQHRDPEVRELAAFVRESSSRRKRILEHVQEALGQLRVDMKYLMFDLHCTRRERDEARGEL